MGVMLTYPHIDPVIKPKIRSVVAGIDDLPNELSGLSSIEGKTFSKEQ